MKNFKKILFRGLLAASFVLVFAFPSLASAAPGYYKSLTLDAAQAGSADSTNWVLTVGLDGNVYTADADLKTTGNGGYVENSSGYDVRFWSDSGLSSALDFELEGNTYNAATGAGVWHVRIPTLSHTSNTIIYMSFGDASISTDGSSTAAWNSNFKGVYHLANGSSLSTADATATAGGNNVGATATSGNIDGGGNFVKASSQFIDLNEPGAVYSPITVSAWINAASFPAGGDANTIFSKGYDGTSTEWALTTNNGGAFGFNSFTNPTTHGVNGVSTLSTSTWYLLTGVYDGTTWRIYLNGTQDNSAVDSGPASGSNFVAIGAVWVVNSVRTQFFDGKIDEVRLSNTNRSASWVTSDYNSQKASSTFITFGSRTAVGGSLIKTIIGLAKASVKTVLNLAIASMKSRNGLQ